jgi:hypothetical protein
MHILFLDESGTPPPPGRDDVRYFVMGGVIIPEGIWPDLRNAILGMKIRRKIRGELKWRYFAPTNNDPRNPMRNLDGEARNEIRSEVYKIMGEQAALKSLAAICSISAAYAMPSVNDQQAIYNLTFKVMTERFQYYLQDVSRQNHRPEYGMIISDHRGSDDDKRLRAHHQMLINSTAAFTSDYPNLIESLLLQPSNLSVGIQFADLVAGAIWRRFERGDENWFEKMQSTLRRSRTGVIDGYGLIKVPKAGWQ